MTQLKRVLINAGIIAGITFFSSLTTDYPPRMENVYAAILAAGLTLLITLKAALQDTNDYNNNPPLPPLGMLV